MTKSPSCFLNEERCRAISVLMGGTVLHLIVGIKIMWGNITPYVTSYLRRFDPSVSFHNTLHVYTMTFLGQAISMYHGGWLEGKIGPRLTALLGTALISGGTLLASFSKRLELLVISQGIVGVGIGIAYSAPIICCFKYFPEKKGIVTGIITTGTGAGPFLFNIVATLYVNPHGLHFNDQGLFEPNSSVVHRVPGMFRVLSACFAIAGLIGASLLSDPDPNDDGKTKNVALETIESGLLLYEPEEAGSKEGTSRPPRPPRPPAGECDGLLTSPKPLVARYSDLLRMELPSSIPDSVAGGKKSSSQVRSLTTPDMIKDHLCWLVIASSISTGVIGLYLVATFKTFAQDTITDDHFLTLVGCIGCLCTGLFRTLWGSMADHMGTFKTLEVVSYANPILLILYTFTSHSRVAFACFFCALMALWGANYALYPSVTAMLFGEENMGTNYGFIFFVFGVLSTLCIDSCGWTDTSFATLNMMFAALGVLGGVLASRLDYLTLGFSAEAEAAVKHHRVTSSVASFF